MNITEMGAQLLALGCRDFVISYGDTGEGLKWRVSTKQLYRVDNTYIEEKYSSSVVPSAIITHRCLLVEASTIEECFEELLKDCKIEPIFLGWHPHE